MLMRKETATVITTIQFGDFYSKVVKTEESKRTGKIRKEIRPLTAFAQSPAGYRHQLETQGYEVIK